MVKNIRRMIIASAADAFLSMQVCRSTKPLYQYLRVSTVLPRVGHSL
jgi:hypothetical protein